MDSPHENATELKQLALKMASGDQDALAECFSLFHDRLARMLCFRMPESLGKRLDVEDLLQEAFLASAQRLDTFENRGEHSPLIWLRLMVLQTLTEQCRRHLGAQRRNAGREISLNARAAASPQATSISMARMLIGSITSPSGAAMREEAIRRLELSLDAMEPIDREVLALRHFEELTNAETAAALDITPKAASIRYVRALRRLKEMHRDES